MTKEEQTAAISAFNNPSATQGSGLKFSSNKYFTLEATPDHVYGKKGVSNASKYVSPIFPSLILIQADGCVVVKTKQAVIVAIYVGPIQQPECVPVVEKLGDYLKSVNY